MKRLFLLLCLSLLIGCAGTEVPNWTDPEFRPIRIWDRNTPNPNDFQVILIPGWMPDFYGLYGDYDTTTMMPADPYDWYGLWTVYYFDKEEKDRQEDGALDSKCYMLAFYPADLVRDFVIAGLMYCTPPDPDPNTDPMCRFWIYPEGEKPVEPCEVSEDEWHDFLGFGETEIEEPKQEV
jgi:hypothetical protein